MRSKKRPLMIFFKAYPFVIFTNDHCKFNLISRATWQTNFKLISFLGDLTKTTLLNLT